MRLRPGAVAKSDGHEAAADLKDISLCQEGYTSILRRRDYLKEQQCQINE